MHRSKIEWCRNPDGSLGWVWNPITGCLNGCEYCYARKLANTRLRERYLANTNLAYREIAVQGEVLKTTNAEHFDNPFYPRSWFDRRERALEGGKPKGVFVCGMSDLFGIGIPESWTECVLETIKVCPQHRFYLLTKQPQNLIKFSPFPDNCWVGVSATNANMLFMAMHYLEDIQAGKKFISIEPMLEGCYSIGLDRNLRASADWVIIGSQTKPYKPPKIEWVTEIIRACDKASIPVFLKNNLNSENLPANAFNKEGFVRQEMPDSIPLGVGVKNDTG